MCQPTLNPTSWNRPHRDHPVSQLLQYSTSQLFLFKPHYWYRYFVHSPRCRTISHRSGTVRLLGRVFNVFVVWGCRLWFWYVPLLRSWSIRCKQRWGLYRVSLAPGSEGRWWCSNDLGVKGETGLWQEFSSSSLQSFFFSYESRFTLTLKQISLKFNKLDFCDLTRHVTPLNPSFSLGNFLFYFSRVKRRMCNLTSSSHKHWGDLIIQPRFP